MAHGLKVSEAHRPAICNLMPDQMEHQVRNIITCLMFYNNNLPPKI
jgi:hypothetical protein